MAAPQSWQIHWQVPFQSLGGINYTVNIYEWAYSGSVVTLKGGPEPFVTQEDNDDNIFRPVRRQTGYLRVVLTGAEVGYMEQLQPANNTEKLVRLTHTENNATIIDWQGFMQTRVFSQPWEASTHLVEFPLNSMLASLEHKRVASSYANSGTIRALGAITSAFESLGENLMGGCDMIDDCGGVWATVVIDWNAFFSAETEQEDGYTMQTQYGNSWLNVVEMICETFGVQARENGNRLVLAQYDNGSHLSIRTMDWATAKSVGSGQSSLPAGTALSSPTDVLQNAEWRGSDNQANYLPGAHKIEIAFTPGNNGDSAVMVLPTQNPDDEVTAETVVLKNPEDGSGRVWIQNFNDRVDNIEAFLYKQWNGSAYSNSDRQHCMDVSVMGSATGTVTYSGAWPCIFGDRRKAYASVMMKPGIFLQQIWYNDQDPHLMTDCYRLRSVGNISLKAGTYLNINFNQHSFYFKRDEDDHHPINVIYEGDGLTIPRNTVLALAIRVGNKCFSGTRGMYETLEDVDDNNLENYCKGSWVSDARDIYEVCVGFQETEIIPNIIDNIDLISYDGGILIPITEDVTGPISIGIRNQCIVQGGVFDYCGSRIIDNLSVKILHAAPPYYSSENTNHYKKTLNNGFKADISKTLSLGTINCNMPSPALLLNTDGTYLKTIVYTPGETGAQRPERHLLQRMGDYYNATRHAYAAQVLQGLDLYTTRWQIDSSIYMAVDATHEWAIDRQSVRFIETENITI